VKERPILMSAPMVRAILEGKKTQTRRAVRPQPDIVEPKTGLVAMFHPDDAKLGRLGKMIRYPYGAPGDSLYARETWAWPGEEQVIYRADPESAALVERWKSDPNYPQVKWRPSIFMPRWASRITLKITDVRVERLHDITANDARAEGIGPVHSGLMALRAYRAIWEEINGRRIVGRESVGMGADL
jgi:hypothetical protein